MKKTVVIKILICFALAGLVFWAWRILSGSHADTVMANARFPGETLIIDAGHGGVDGGAVSVRGTVESKINLEIALKLDAIMGLFGVNVKMLRSEDISLHDSSADTIREKKVSDLHNRVKMIEETPNATLISIHQNIFAVTKYSGAQVFYTSEESSKLFAISTQETLRLSLNKDNDRVAAKVPATVYLMNHISCRAILVECGFLSNPAEDALLQSDAYQIKIAAALASSYLDFEQKKPEGDNPNAA
ncbi:hypothetical protein SDC9_58096 [bioreactor metagenome]|uniref:MurNAc-LAA domain-containing protein n=1 Tax=bioreactor metagenome TaxID=1076179 RepID=A0A644X6I5_9ZZZZ